MHLAAPQVSPRCTARANLVSRYRGRRLARLNLVCLLVLASASPLLAQDRTVQIKATVDVDTITIGDVVRVTVEATRLKAVRIAFPQVGQKLGEWVVRDSQLLPPKEISPGIVIDTL